MSFISVLVALLLEQVRPLNRGNPVHAALRAWVRWNARNFDAGKAVHGGLAWSISVILPAVAAMSVHWLLDIFVGWPATVVWSVAVLYVTLGFRQFSFHFTQIRDALADGNEALARELLANWRQVDEGDLPQSEIVRHVIEHSVLSAHRHVFGVLAWFSLLAALGLGPAGAVLYRLGEFVARYWQHASKTRLLPVSEALKMTASNAWAVIDWVPSRITALGFAVVGSFEEAIDCWRNYEQRVPSDNDGIVLAATSGAVNIRLQGVDGQSEMFPGQTPELAHLAVVVGLVWRTVVMWMVLLALLTLARLLG
jgi:adenosylcobinamide-phosphate synthase